ncbi:YjgN family protein [Erwinia sp. AnSW2-5]|uniref:YjgN family protein n=1 Tax=Erwinia sp. AnSW2-5 TaxID=3367692 RepID=UPI00385F533D
MENNTSNQQRHAVLFHGRSGEYFSIWLVNALLTMITLGIYSAWATVRRRRYFYGNTEIAGDRFDYHARPIDILKGRIIVFVGLVLFFILSSAFPAVAPLFVLAFFALIPWIIIRSWRYNALMSSFRGVRFNYLCRVGRAYWTMFLCPVLLVLALYLVVGAIGFFAANTGSISAALTVGILAFVLFLAGLAAVQGSVAALNHDLYINNMSYGSLPFKAELSKKAFIKMVLISFLIMLPFLIIAGMLIGSLFVSIFYAVAMGMTDPEMLNSLMAGNIFNIFLTFLILLFGGLVSSAYLVVAQRNYVFGQTQLGEKLRLKSTMSTGSFLGLTLTNTLIVIFTLGLGTPIAEVRLARYMANSTALEGDISLLDVQAHNDSAGTAVAEEVVAAFDLNPGI